MGVRGLQTYVEKECPAACKTVYLEQAADIHRKQFNCHPVIVVDGMSLSNRLYSNSTLEWIYGGQWMQYLKLLEHFIKKFGDIGVELVFFFDGTVCSSKREEWVKRRITKYGIIASIFSHIKTNQNEPDQKLFQLPTSMGLLAAFALKELGARVYQTDREADDVIVEYANRNQEVFGILSQDSDFIIYDTKPYYSLTHLDVDSLQTIHYDRNCLASRYLNLDVHQLSLFACLVGNHFVTFDKLRNFHRRLTNKGPIYVAAIAPNLSNVIKLERWTGNPLNEMELNRISKFVFGHTKWTNLLYDGLRSYAVGEPVPPPPKACISIHPDFEKAMYSRSLDCTNAPYIFNLLCKLEYGCSEVLEDITTKPSALIYREIRQRCYGVLFNFSPSTYQPYQMQTTNRLDIDIKEWCAYHGNYMEKPELIKPLPLKNLTSRTPSIEELWFQSSEIEKLKIFWSIFQLPMDFNLLLTIPRDLLIFSCIINYLIGGSTSAPHLKPWEVAVFVAQAVWKINVMDLEQLQVPWVDAAAVNLSTLFMRGVTTALMVLGICGNPIPVTYAMPWHFFDGKLFHYVYTKAKQQLTVHEICRNQVETIEHFYKLLAIVTNNTIYDVKKLDWPSFLVDFEYQVTP